MARQHIPLIPLEPVAFRVHLTLDPDSPSGEDPFLRLDNAGGKTRTYLGTLRSASGIEVLPVVVQVPPLRFASGCEMPLEQEEEEWQRRRMDRSVLLESAPELFPQHLLPGKDASFTQKLPPMVYCPTRERVFPIPSPKSLKPLLTCRNDELLLRCGLPTFGRSSLPLLVDEPSLDGDERPQFYVAAESAPAELMELGVLGLGDLRKHLAATLTERAGEDGFNSASYPGTTEGWVVVTEYDVPYLVSRYEPWSFDHFVDYLGGRDLEPIHGSQGKGGVQSGKERNAHFLFAVEGSGLDAVEVLTLKLTLFDQVVQALDRHYRELGPHLDLHPGHLVVATPGPTVSDLPDAWSFQVRLLGLSSARRVGLPQGVEHVEPPMRPRRPYASRAMREAALIEAQTGELLIDGIDQEVQEGTSRWVIRGRLRDPNGILPPPRKGDLVVIHWPHQLFGSADFKTTAQADPETSRSAAELAFVTEPLELEALVIRRLETAVSTVLSGGRYRLVPRLHIIDDLHALGVLLLRLLLVNDHQDLSQVDKLLEGVPDLTAVPMNEQGTGFALEQHLESSLANALEGYWGQLAPSNLFYSEDDRLADRANAVPQEFWHEVLRLAWRLVARGPGFGLKLGGLFDEDHPVVHLEQVHGEIRALLRQLHLMLFRRQGVHVEIHSVIAEMMADI